MTLQDKSLYHQIHPAKLLTDWGTGIIALYLLWQHALVMSLLVMFIPSAVVSFVLVGFANLETVKAGRFGKYVSTYMTRAMEAMRLAGYIVMAIGAWLHVVWLIPLGLSIILAGWLRGIINPMPSSPHPGQRRPI